MYNQILKLFYYKCRFYDNWFILQKKQTNKTNTIHRVILTPFMYSCILRLCWWQVFEKNNRTIYWPHIPCGPDYDWAYRLKSVTTFSVYHTPVHKHTLNFDECITHQTHFTNAVSECEVKCFSGRVNTPLRGPPGRPDFQKWARSKFSMTLTHAVKTQIWLLMICQTFNCLQRLTTYQPWKVGN